MKILITGGAGFIGSHVVDGYIKEGHEVIAVDNLSSGKRSNLPKTVRLIKMDIRDKRLEEIFKKERFDVLNHHAAQIDVRKSVGEPAYDAQVNVVGTINLLNFSRVYGVKKFIFASSGGAMYGDDVKLPVKEGTPENPLSPYGVAKKASEMYITCFNRLHKLDYTILRYANVYGPRQDPKGEAGVVAIFTSKMLRGIRPTIFGDGKQIRDYVYVKDVVQASLLSIKKDCPSIFNIGTGIPTSVSQLFKKLASITNFKGEPIYTSGRPGELLRSCLDSNRARSVLNWSPRWTIEDGLIETVRFFRR